MLAEDKSMRAVHRQQDFVGSVFLDTVAQSVDPPIQTLLQYELTLKNGSSTSSSASSSK
jgi:hypothetical protein